MDDVRGEILVRPLLAADVEAVVRLGLAAWTPVFDSIEQQLAGSGVFERLYPDWRSAQSAAIEAACRDSEQTWVATESDLVVGFVAVVGHRESSTGEIHMVAVAPAHQSQGVGAALTRQALDWMRDEGLTTAMVETGGDTGHAPARATYESAGFIPLPIVRYFQAL